MSSLWPGHAPCLNLFEALLVCQLADSDWIRCYLIFGRDFFLIVLLSIVFIAVKQYSISFILVSKYLFLLGHADFGNAPIEAGPIFGRKCLPWLLLRIDTHACVERPRLDWESKLAVRFVQGWATAAVLGIGCEIVFLVMQVEYRWGLSNCGCSRNWSLIHDIHEILPLDEVTLCNAESRGQYVKVREGDVMPYLDYPFEELLFRNYLFSSCHKRFPLCRRLIHSDLKYRHWKLEGWLLLWVWAVDITTRAWGSIKIPSFWGFIGTDTSAHLEEFCHSHISLENIFLQMSQLHLKLWELADPSEIWSEDDIKLFDRNHVRG